MESSADTTTALRGVPLTLAQHYPTIAGALSGKATAFIQSKELEDEPIHYSHARYTKKSEKGATPQSHTARSAQEYLQVFEKLNAEKVAQCYRFLCDLTHPGAPSVWMWLAALDPQGTEFTLSMERDEAIIASFLEMYETVVIDVLMLAFNAPVLVLNTLNYFPVKKLHTEELLNHDLNGLAAWAKCQTELEKGGAQLLAVKQ